MAAATCCNYILEGWVGKMVVKVVGSLVVELGCKSEGPRSQQLLFYHIQVGSIHK